MFKGQGQTTRSISFDPFTWSIPNLVQGLHPISRWSLFIFRSHVQRSRSNHSSKPSVLSTSYILIAWLHVLASYRLCFYREDKPEFCTMGGIDVSETFLVLILVFVIWPTYMYMCPVTEKNNTIVTWLVTPVNHYSFIYIYNLNCGQHQ